MKILKYLQLILTMLALPSCQTIDAVIAQSSGELTFEAQDNWDYAAKVAPDELIHQVRDENLDENWIGDARRFYMMRVQYVGQKYPLYLVIPAIKCESERCPQEIHRPLCGVANRCAYFVYLEKHGEFQKVWGKLFYTEGDTPLFKVSRQIKDGVPTCLEMGGIDSDTYDEKAHSRGENQIFRSRYCFNGEEYVLTQLDRIPENPLKTP